MRLTLTYNGCFDIHHRAIRALFHLLDCNCNAVRNFFLKTSKCLLSNHLCCNLTHWLISDSILIIIHWAIRQITKYSIKQCICIDTSKCRNGYHLIKVCNLTVCLDALCHCFLLYCISLVDDQKYRTLELAKLLCNLLLASSDKGGRLNKPHDNVSL